MTSKHTFGKAERISLKRETERLFSEGKSFCVYPLRVVYLEQKPCSDADVAILVSVPKKKFKRAVHRNRLKRLIREAYRLNKEELLATTREKDSGLLLAFLFIGNALVSYATVESAFLKIINEMKTKML